MSHSLLGIFVLESMYSDVSLRLAVNDIPALIDLLRNTSFLIANQFKFKEISNERNEPKTSIAPPLADTILVSLNVDVIGSENKLYQDGPHNDSTKSYLSMGTEELSFVFFVLAIICVTVLPLLMVWIVIMNAIAPSKRKNKIDNANYGLKIYTIHIV